MYCNRFKWRRPCFFISFSLFLLCCPHVAQSASLQLQFCPAATVCSRATLGHNSTLADLFDCLGKLLFEQPHSQWNQNQIWMHHDCGNVGWGNFISALSGSAALALMLGARLHIAHGAFHRSFDVLNGSSHAYPHPIWAAPIFDYSEHATSVQRLNNFARDARRSLQCQSPNPPARCLKPYRARTSGARNWAYYESEIRKSRVLKSGVCGLDGVFLKAGHCVDRLLAEFGFVDCIEQNGVPRDALNAPFMHSLVRHLSPKLKRRLHLIRQRIGLPPTSDSEVVHTLQARGFYTIAFHYRSVPLGFEPTSLNRLTEDIEERRRRLQRLDEYFEAGKTAIARARQLANCKNAKLIIYFAADDFALRQRAVREFGSDVVFGTRERELGHMSPQWDTESEQRLQVALQAYDQSLVNKMNDQSMHEEPVRPQRAEADQRRHADWGFAEWYALSTADWLVGSPSNFALTATGAALRPHSKTQRFGTNGFIQRAWNSSNICAPLPSEAQLESTCPQYVL